MSNEKSTGQDQMDSGFVFSAWVAVLNNLEVGVTVFSPDLRIEYVNDTYRNIVGIPPSIGTGDAAFDIYEYMAGRGDFGEGEPEKLANERLIKIASDKWSNAVHTMNNGRINKIRREVMDDGFIVSTITDITEIRNRETEVSEKEALMASVLESTDQGMLITDNDKCGTVELFNTAFTGMFGEVENKNGEQSSYYDYIYQAWKNGRLAGEGINQLSDDEFLSRTLKLIDKAKSENLTIELSDGRYVKFKCRNIENDRKIFTFTDVTNAQNREKELREACKLSDATLTDFDAVINNMDVGLLLLDSDLNALVINNAFHRIWGTDAKRFSDGSSFRSLMDINRNNGIYDVEDADWEDYVESRVAEVKAGEIKPREFFRSDGKTLVYSCIPLTNGQRLVRYNDITEFKNREIELNKAHEKAENTANDFSAAINNMDVALLLLDRNLNVLMANDSLYKIWDIKPEEFPVGENVQKLMEINRQNNVYSTSDHDWKEDDWQAYMQERLAAVRQGEIAPHEFVSSDSRTFIFSCAPLSDGQRLIRYSNITEYKNREAELELAQKRAESADRSKSEFLANMSHEIRTPMNGVMGMAELLGKTELNPKQKMFTDVILNSSTALLTIINDILDFSKIEAGKLELDPVPFFLGEAIEDIATLVSSGVAEKNLELIVRLQPDLAGHVVGDVGRFRQVLTNLIGNAVKFTENGHILVDISGEEANGAVALNCSIKDTGIGIPEDQIGSVFEKFSQVDATSTRRHEGTGLGLAITSRLISLMGGEVGCESTVGEGSTFWFTVEFPIDGSAKPAPVATPLKIAGAKVLAIDDNPVNRSILLEQFEAWKLNGSAAGSGLEGLAMLRNSQRDGRTHDAIVLDYHMPDMNGIDVSRVIRNDGNLKNIPIIMLTSVDNISETAEFKSLNIDAHLTKPARSSQLLEDIIHVVRLRRKSADAVEEPVLDTGNKANPVNRPSVAHDDEDINPALHQDISGNSQQLNPFDSQTAEVANLVEASTPENLVIVAEDNEVNQMVFTQILQHENYNFKIVDNGKKAVEEAIASRPLLILMDVSMPVMNGIEATQEIRRQFAGSNNYRPWIIGVTAHALKDDREKCLDAGMDDYMSKPISPDMLVEKIKNLVPELAVGHKLAS